jgi:hypothetical protein
MKYTAWIDGYLAAVRAEIEVCFCASFLAQTKKERSATSGLIHNTTKLQFKSV